MAEPLYLVHGRRAISLTRGAVALGRLPECEVLLEGSEVSRRHARIVATPEGPLLVDRSRFGTVVSGAPVVGPALLVDGDVIQIGSHELLVTAAPEAHGATLTSEGTAAATIRTRLTAWRRRYGLSEAIGALIAVLAALAVRRGGGGLVPAAFAATFAEAVWFYASLAWREYRRARGEALAAAPPLAVPAARDVFRNLALEFGAAEAVDSLLLRPACYAIGMRSLGSVPGILAGKLAADVLFWGPVLRAFHWRLAANPRAPAPAGVPRQTRAATNPRLPAGDPGAKGA